MTPTTQLPKEKISASTALSDYAKFHFAFLGYSFLDTRTNKTKSKLEVYLRDKHLAKVMTKTKETPSYYTLVNSTGWDNGNLITNY
jgi:hypothetical protein